MASEGDLTKVAEGREAEMFAWQNGEVLRLLRPGFNPTGLDSEVRALELAHENGLPVPRPGERVSVDGRAGVVLERVEGTDVLTELGRAPWTVIRAARMCGSVHARMHACRVDDREFPILRSSLERQLTSPPVPPELGELAKKRLDALPDGEMLCHGDFHPANVMRSPVGPVVIDWPNATRGAPEGDVARTLLFAGGGRATELHAGHESANDAGPQSVHLALPWLVYASAPARQERGAKVGPACRCRSPGGEH